jgi:hypothetical protein
MRQDAYEGEADMTLMRNLTALMIATALSGVAIPAVAADDDNPGQGASVGDTCQSNKDCDKDAGQHCVKNACTKSGGGGDDVHKDKPAPKPTPSCPGLASGYTVKCQLSTGQTFNACGMAGAVPAQVGSTCHVGYQIGIAVE